MKIKITKGTPNINIEVEEEIDIIIDKYFADKKKKKKKILIKRDAS